MEQINLESIPIIVGKEEDVRWWAGIESMPGVMAYGATRESAIAAVRALACAWLPIALIAAKRSPSHLLRSSSWHEPVISVKAKPLLAALHRVGWVVAWQKGSQGREFNTAPLGFELDADDAVVVEVHASIRWESFENISSTGGRSNRT